MFIIALEKPFQRNFILQVSIGNFSQSFYDLFSALQAFVMTYSSIKDQPDS